MRVGCRPSHGFLSLTRRWQLTIWTAGALALAGALAPSGEASGPRQPASQPATIAGLSAAEPDLFTNGVIPRLAIFLTPESRARLLENSRQDVPARVVEAGGRTYDRVQLHLKGSTGSFRSLDDKPSFTLRFAGPAAEGRFHGLSKLHLNNSVEDPSYFNEYAGRALFRAAGLPAPRVTHALVTLNGRRLGLYVLKEGFTKEFLGRHFEDPRGNLYDPGPGSDVDERLEKDAGQGPDDQSDLAALAAAARELDEAVRWQRLDKVLDVDRFVTFMAVEVIAGHRDGYCLARNNFRIYHDPTTGRMVFLPHGMDQLFGRPDTPIRPAMAGLVARALIQTPEGRQAYRSQIAQLTASVLDVAWFHAEADALLQRLGPNLEERERQDLEAAIADSKTRIALRRTALERQLSTPEPQRLAFVDGRARLTDWHPFDVPTGGSVDRDPAPDGAQALHIRAGPVTSASWRTTVRLAKGCYVFRGRVTTERVEALPFGRNHGAGLRVVGGSASPRYEMLGDQAGTLEERAFEVEAERDMELICELRARAGEAWFRLDSLELESLPSP